MKKRMLSILLALVMCVSMLPMQVFAAQDDSVTVTLDPESKIFSKAETSALATSLLTLDSNGKVALKATNEVEWIDRLDLTGADYALDFYDYLVENSAKGGALRTTNVAEYTAATFTGKGEFTYTGDKAVDSEAAYAAIADEFTANWNEASAYLSAVYYAFDRDHPEVFWLSGESMFSWEGGFSYSSDGTVTYEQTIYFVLRDLEEGYEFDIRDGRYLDENLNLDETWINDIDAEGQALATDRACYVTELEAAESREAALRWLHNILTEKNEYNTSADLSSADSLCWEYVTAIVGSEGTKGPVCEAYARAFKVVCDKAGIPCVLVDGFASPDGVNGEAHMWNYVQMEDGLWYAVDVTWDDPVVAGVSEVKSGYEHEDYFLVGAQTEIDGVTFEVSHPVSNAPSSSAPNFTNGPVLSDDAYVASESGGTGDTGDTGDSKEPRLMAYLVEGDGAGGWVDPGYGMEDAWYFDGTYLGTQAVFCFGTEDDYIELDMDDLWVSDEKAVVLTNWGYTAEGFSVVEVAVYEFGDYTICYEDDTGLVHKMPVYVYLPSVGYFSEPEISEEAFLHQFVLTETNRTYYLVSGVGDIISVELSEDDADLADCLEIKWQGNYASITFTENPPYTWMYPYLYVTIDRGDDYGYDKWGLGLEVLANESGEGGGEVPEVPGEDESRLMFYHVGMNDEIGAWVDMGWGMKDAWYSDGIYLCAQVVFCFGTEDNYIELDMDDLWVSDEKAVELTYEGTNTAGSDVMTLNVYEFGNHTIYYEDDTGVVHKMPVYVYLPDVGYFSEPVMSEETYLSKFVLTETNRTVYLVSNKGNIMSIEVNDYFADCTEVTIYGNYAEITFTDVPDFTEKQLYLNVTIDRGEDYPDGWECGLGLNVVVGGAGGDVEEPVEPEYPSDSGMCGDDLYWTLENGVLTIYGTGAMYDYTGIGTPWSNYSSYIYEVIVEEGVTTLGETAFAYLYDLTKATLPDSLVVIDRYAFVLCTALTEITIPANVALINSQSFTNCTSLSKITFLGDAPQFKDDIYDGEDAFTGVTATVYYPAGNTTWTETVMQNYGGTLTWVAMGGPVTPLTQIPAPTDLTWGRYYYRDYENDVLTYAEYPGMMSWRSGTFDYRHDIEIKVYRVSDDGTEDIEVFWNCWYCGRSDLEYNTDHDFSLSALEEMESGTYYFTAQAIGDGETTMDSELVTSGTWTYTRPTERLSAPTGLAWDGFVATWDRVSHEAVGGYTVDFYYSPDESGENLECVTGFVRYSCEGEMLSFVPNFDMGNGYYWFEVKTVSADMNTVLHSEYSELSEPVYFEFDWDLDENGVLTIRGNGAVAAYWIYDPAITKVVIEEGITSIPVETFYCCENLTEVVIPGSVTEVGAYAFAWCEALENITFTGDAPSIGEYAFANVTATVYYPADNDTWTEAVMENYGGTLTWEPVGEVVPEIVDSGYCGDNLTWELTSDGVLTISGSGRMYDYAYQGLPEWYEYATDIQTVCLSKEQTSIGGYAFYDLCNLTVITVPDSVESIGEYAFWGCKALEQVSFGSGLKSIGEYSFLYCYALEAVNFGSTLESIGTYAFSECTSLTEVVIPGNVTSLGMGAFSRCTALTKVELGSGVNTLNHFTFQGCSALKEVVGLEHVTTINNYVFAGTALTEITIPASVETIGKWTFQSCESMTKVVFEGDAPSIGDYAFQSVTATCYYPADKDGWDAFLEQWDTNFGGTLTWVAIGGEEPEYPEDPEIVDSGYCGDDLTWVLTFDGTLTISGTGAMYDWHDCEAPWYEYYGEIFSVVLPEGLTNIGKSAFFECYLTEVVIPDSVTEVGYHAFAYCGDMETAALGSGVENIDKEAFFNCESLTEIAIPDNVVTIGEKAFEYCIALEKVTLGSSLESIGKQAFYYCENLKEIVLPDSLTTIGVYAFEWCFALEKVALGSGVETIEAGAFSECEHLAEIVIPASVETIGDSAFGGCIGLTRITFEGDAPDIDEWAFDEVAATVYYPGGNATWTKAVMQDYGGELTWVALGGEEPEVPNDLAVSNLHFDYLGSGPLPYLYWTAPTGVEGNLRYNVYVSTDGGQSWTMVSSTSQELISLTGLGAAVYTAFKVETKLDGKVVAECSAKLTLTVTQGEDLPAATVVITEPEVEGEDYDIVVSGLTPRTWIRFTLKRTNGSGSSGSTSDVEGRYFDSESWDNMSEYLADETSAYLVQEYSGGSVSEDGLSAGYTVANRGGWTLLSDAMGGGNDEPEVPETGYGIEVWIDGPSLIATITGPADAEPGAIYTYYFYNTEDPSVSAGLGGMPIGAWQPFNFRPGTYNAWQVLRTEDGTVLGEGMLAKPIVSVADAFEHPAVTLTKGEYSADNGSYAYILGGLDLNRYTYTMDTETSGYYIYSDTVYTDEHAFDNGAVLYAQLNSDCDDCFMQELSCGLQVTLSGGEEPEEPVTRLMFCHLDRTEEGGLVERPEWGLSDGWDGEIDTSSTVRFYLVTGDERIPVELEDLSATGGVELRDDAGYVEIRAYEFGQYQIIYTDIDGVEYSLPVTVGLPMVGFYKDKVASEENYLYGEFTVTDESNTFYVVPREGVLTNVSLNDRLANIAELTVSKDRSYAAVTVTGVPDGGRYSMLVEFEAENWSGSWGVGLNIGDSRPHLMYRSFYWNENDEMVEEQWFQTEYHASIQTGMSARFYFGTEKDFVAVDPENLSVSGKGIHLEWVYTDDGLVDHVIIHTVDFGDYKVIYTTADGEKYTLPVTVGLPDVGFYSESVASEKSYLYEAFTVTAENNTFYLVPINGALTNVELLDELAKIATVTMGENGSYAAITVNGIPSGRWYNLRVEFTDSYGNNRRWGVGLELFDGNPHLMYRGFDQNENGEMVESDRFRTDWNTSIRSGMDARFYFGTEKDFVAVDPASLSVSGDGIYLEWVYTEDGLVDYVEIHTVKFGEYQVIYTDADGVKYTLPVSVGLPPLGFYSQPEASEAAYLEKFTVTGENNTVYLIPQSFKLISVKLNEDFAKIATVTVAEDGSYATVTITGTPSGYWYHLDAVVENAVGERWDWGAGLEIVDGNPHLMFRSFYWNENDELVEDTEGFGNRWYASIQSGLRARFYFGTEDSYVAVDPTSLTVSGDGIYLEWVYTEDGEVDHVWINAVDFGDYEIIYTTADGEKYSLPVSVGLPDVGLYSEPVAGEKYYLYEKFTVTAENNTFYVAPINGALTNVRLMGELANIATVTMAEDGSYAAITVTGAPSGRWYNLSVQFEDSYGNNRGWGLGLNIYDGNPHLMYRYESGEGLHSRWEIEPGMSSHLVFYFGAEGNYTEVDFGRLSVSDSSALTLSEGDGFVRVSAGYTCGEYSIIYTAEDGKTYELPVVVALPDVGVYSTSFADPYTRTIRFVVTDESDTFYVVSVGGGMDGVTLSAGLAEIAEITEHGYNEDGEYIAIKVTGTPVSGVWYEIELVYYGYDGLSKGTRIMSVMLEDARTVEPETPVGQLIFRAADWTPETGWFDNPDYGMMSEWNCEIHSGMIGKFLFVTDTECVELTIDQLTVSGNGVELGESNGFIYMSSNNDGSYKVMYTHTDGVTYSFDVNVTLPNVAFYTQPVADGDYYVNVFKVTEMGQMLCLVPSNGYKLIDISVFPELSAIAQFEFNVGENYVIMAITGVPADRWYDVEVTYGNETETRTTTVSVRLLNGMVDNQAPFADLAVSGTLFGGTVYAPVFTIAASDNEGLEKVELTYTVDGMTCYIDELYLNGPKAAETYEWNVKGLPSGEYTVTAVVYDLSGNASEPASVAILVDNDPPLLEYTEIWVEEGIVYLDWGYQGEDLAYATLYRDYYDEASDETIETVMQTKGGERFEDDLNGQPDGVYTYILALEDFLGNIGYSEPVEILVDMTAPELSVAGPEEGSRVWGEITFDITAKDAYGVDWVTLYCENEYVDADGTQIIFDTTVLPDGPITVTIEAVDLAGNTAEVVLTYIVDNVPAIPAEFTAEYNEYGVLLTWTPSEPEDNVSYYNVLRAEVSEAGSVGDYDVICEISAAGDTAQYEYQDYTEDFVGTYIYMLEVVSRSAECAETKPVEVVCRDMVAPGVTVFELIDQWTVFGGTGSRSVPSFLISSTDNVGVDYMILTYTDANGASVSDRINIPECSYGLDVSGLPSGVCTVTVVAYDLAGNASDPASIVITVDNDPPAAPEYVTAEGDFEKIVLNWVLDTTGDTSLYRIERDGVEISVVGVGVSSYTDNTAQPGVEYSYCVVAEDELGNRAESAAVKAQRVKDDQAPVILDMWPTTEDNVTFCYNGTVALKLSDNWKLAKVEAFCGGELVYAAKMGYADGYLEFLWDVSKLSGEQTLDIAVTDAAGNVTERSVTVTVRPYSAPVIPGNLTAVAGFKTASLKWTYSGDLKTLKQFKVYSCDADYTNPVLVNNVKNYKYTVKNLEQGAHYFVVVAEDIYGNLSDFARVEVYLANEDSEAPVAVILPKDPMGVEGIAIDFSGVNSTDNDKIASYSWNFGDGTTGTGVNCSHAYSQPGSYTVTLTVTDRSGNKTVAEKEVTVLDVTGADATHSIVTVTVMDGYVEGTPAIANATVTIYDEAGFEITALTDENGKAELVVPNGVCNVAAAASGYTASGRKIVVQGNETGRVDCTVYLAGSSVKTVDGSLTTHVMTYEEIVAAGIDTTDPANQHVVKHAFVLEFKATPELAFEIPVVNYTNRNGDRVDIPRQTVWYEFEVEDDDEDPGTGSSPDWDRSIPMKVGVFPITEHFYLVIYGETHWLKEMFNVELLVINNSYAENITDCIAELELPEGLSLASMLVGGQSPVVSLGDIGHIGNTDGLPTQVTTNWYVRGDKEGEYTLTANVTGNFTQDLYNKTPFSTSFTTDAPIKVYAGSALKLFISAQDTAYYNTEYYVQFKLQNVSDRTLYNVSFGLTGAEQYRAEIQHRGKEGDVIKELDKLSEEHFGDAFYTVEEFRPGDAITVNFCTKTLFLNEEWEAFADKLEFINIAYKLQNVFVMTLEGSTTEIPYEVEILPVAKQSFAEWLWDQTKESVGDAIKDGAVGLIDATFFGGIPVTENVVKVFEYAMDEYEKATNTADSYMTITLERGAYFDDGTSTWSGRSAQEGVRVYTDGKYEVAEDGSIRLYGDGKLYVERTGATVDENGNEIEPEISVTTHYVDGLGEVQEYTYSLVEEDGKNFVADEDDLQLVVEEVYMEPPVGPGVTYEEVDGEPVINVEKPSSDEPERVITFPFVLLNKTGNLVTDGSNVLWQLVDALGNLNPAGMYLDQNGNLTIDANAKPGDYTVILSLIQDLNGQLCIRDGAMLMAAADEDEPVTSVEYTFTLLPADEEDPAVELFDITKTNVIMGQNLALLFAFEKSNITDADLSDYVAEVSIAYKDERGTVTGEVSAADWTTVKIGGIEYWMVTVSNLAAKEMDDDVTVTIYKGDTAVSNPKTMSLRQYAEERLAASQNDLFRTVVVDMLNYGAEAQEYFGYNTANPANRNITEYQHLATQTVTLDQQRKILSDENNHFIASNVKFESDIVMMFAVARESAAVSGKITFTNHLNKEVVTVVDTFTNITANGKAAKMFEFTGMVVADIDQVITVEFFDEAGNVVLSLTDSLDAYLGRVKPTSAMYGLAGAFGKFSTSAYAYLH